MSRSCLTSGGLSSTPPDLIGGRHRGAGPNSGVRAGGVWGGGRGEEECKRVILGTWELDEGSLCTRSRGKLYGITVLFNMYWVAHIFPAKYGIICVVQGCIRLYSIKVMKRKGRTGKGISGQYGKGKDRTRQDRAKHDFTKQDRTGQDETWQDRKDKAEYDRKGQDRVWQDRIGLGRNRKDMTWQDMKGQAKTKRHDRTGLLWKRGYLKYEKQRGGCIKRRNNMTGMKSTSGQDRTGLKNTSCQCKTQEDRTEQEAETAWQV